MKNKLGFLKNKLGLKRGYFKNKLGLNTKNKLGFEKSLFLK